MQSKPVVDEGGEGGLLRVL